MEYGIYCILISYCYDFLHHIMNWTTAQYANLKKRITIPMCRPDMKQTRLTCDMTEPDMELCMELVMEPSIGSVVPTAVLSGTDTVDAVIGTWLNWSSCTIENTQCISAH